MLFLTLMFVLLSFIIRGINRRLQHIIATIHREGVEWMEGSPAPDGDFIMLESSVDRLILRAKMLMEQTYRAQMLEREAQLRALQAQINPHFLYNTLDTINWIAIGRNATDISRMIEGLAKYFRLSLSKGRDVVSVADEITLARVYLDIQQTRFPSSFQYETEVEDGLDNYVMPKLILQPIVENALLHGIHETKTKCGIIRITVKRIDDELLLTVCDDGLGMEEGKVKQLLAGPHIESELDGVGSSYGLYNVNERIRMYSGDQYGLSIISSLGKGTTVTLRLKAVMQKSAQ
jgi:two-component system sensor histidine kinase YesM